MLLATPSKSRNRQSSLINSDGKETRSQQSRATVLNGVRRQGLNNIAALSALIASTSGSRSNGIGAYAGGINQKFISVLVLSLPAIFVIVFFHLSSGAQITIVLEIHPRIGVQSNEQLGSHRRVVDHKLS